MRADELFEVHGARDASRAYWNAFNKLRAAWRDVFDEDLQRIGSRGMEVYENALVFIKDRLGQDAAGERILRDALDIVPADDIGDALLRFDLDQFAPNEVKQAIRDEVDRHRDGDNTRLPLHPLLRKILDGLFAGGGTRRPNVGPIGTGHGSSSTCANSSTRPIGRRTDGASAWQMPADADR